VAVSIPDLGPRRWTNRMPNPRPGSAFKHLVVGQAATIHSQPQPVKGLAHDPSEPALTLVIHRFRVTRCCERHRLPQSVGVTEVFDATNEPLLTHAEVVELQRAIEAGLLACDARISGAGFADATDEELRLLEERGALARQRFIRANLRLVGLVSRQFASRSQLGDAELFQEGCIGLPACQLPTGSSSSELSFSRTPGVAKNAVPAPT
jgi:hypothetical protein